MTRRVQVLFLLALVGVLVCLGLVVGGLAGPWAAAAYAVVALGLLVVGSARARAAQAAARAVARSDAGADLHLLHRQPARPGRGRLMTSPLRVALLGCGTVGAEVVRLLHSSGDDLAARAGAPLELAGIAVRRPARCATCRSTRRCSPPTPRRWSPATTSTSSSR
jgi:hypothetical protein